MFSMFSVFSMFFKLTSDVLPSRMAGFHNLWSPAARMICCQKIYGFLGIILIWGSKLVTWIVGADIEQRTTPGTRKKWLSSGKYPPIWKTVWQRASPCLTQCAKLSLAAAISRRLAGKAGTGFHEPATASPRYGQPGKQKNTNKAWQQ